MHEKRNKYMNMRHGLEDRHNPVNVCVDMEVDHQELEHDADNASRRSGRMAGTWETLRRHTGVISEGRTDGRLEAER